MVENPGYGYNVVDLLADWPGYGGYVADSVSPADSKEENTDHGLKKTTKENARKLDIGAAYRFDTARRQLVLLRRRRMQRQQYSCR